MKLLHGDDQVNGARASGLRHCISIDSHLSRRCWLVHETAHFLAPHVMHDAPGRPWWCRCGPVSSTCRLHLRGGWRARAGSCFELHGAEQRRGKLGGLVRRYLEQPLVLRIVQIVAFQSRQFNVRSFTCGCGITDRPLYL